MQKILYLMMKTAKITGDFQKEKFGLKMQINQKSSHSDLVTEVDIISQDIIVKNLTDGMKKLGYSEEEIGFLGEENFLKKGKYTFVIDPLDATNNFASKLEFFSVIISFFVDNDLKIGVVYRPLNGEIYFSIKKYGSYKANIKNNKISQILGNINNDLNKESNSFQNIQKKIQVDSAKIEKLKIIYKKPEKALISGAFEPIRELSKEFIQKFLGVRILYGFGLEACFVAENITGLKFGMGAKIWDIAAPKLIVEEARGIFVDYYGKTADLDLNQPNKIYPIIICHPQLWSEIKPEITNLRKKIKFFR
jgi:myo-inositol-1(or 4)-monophosphatase